MVRPPREPLSRSSRATLLVFLAMILVTGAIAYYVTFFSDIDDTAQGAAASETAAAVRDAEAYQTVRAATVTAIAVPASPDVSALRPTATATAPAAPRPALAAAVSPLALGWAPPALASPAPPTALASPAVPALPAAPSTPAAMASPGATRWPVDDGTSISGDLPPVAPSPAAAPLPTATPALPPARCDGRCLVRLPDEDATRAALEASELPVAYASGGQLWTGAEAATVDGLRRDGLAVHVSAPSVDTLPLYVVRATPGGGDAAVPLVEGLGAVIDRVGDEFVVRVGQVPPVVTGLTGAGLAVAKFPPVVAPARDAAAADRSALPPIGDADLGDLASAVDIDRLAATIGDLEASSSTDGTGIGTRHYTTTGNVVAAEYLYQRFAEFGAAPRFEDFLTDDGLLALNVVGELPGDDPSQVFLVLAHFDSINDDTIDQSVAPGADDNASGVAAMLEIGRILSERRLAHPVRFFATNVEEVGLQGVQAFTVQAQAEGVTIMGAYNIDAVGSYQHGTQLVLNGDANSAYLQDLLIRLNDEFGLGQALLVRQNSEIVADDSILRDAGFPTILVARELFGWSPTLHTADDTLANMDLANVESCTQLILLAVGAFVGTG